MTFLKLRSSALVLACLGLCQCVGFSDKGSSVDQNYKGQVRNALLINNFDKAFSGGIRPVFAARLRDDLTRCHVALFATQTDGLTLNSAAAVQNYIHARHIDTVFTLSFYDRTLSADGVNQETMRLKMIDVASSREVWVNDFRIDATAHIWGGHAASGAKMADQIVRKLQKDGVLKDCSL